jgi:hypothetical protein
MAAKPLDSRAGHAWPSCNTTHRASDIKELPAKKGRTWKQESARYAKNCTPEIGDDESQRRCGQNSREMADRTEFDARFDYEEEEPAQQK